MRSASPPPGESVGPVLEHDTVRAGDVEQVDVGVEPLGDRPHHPLRVPV